MAARAGAGEVVNVTRSFLYGNTGAGDDPDDVDEDFLYEVDTEPPMAKLIASPNPIERVVQLAMGGEHGILRTDAGCVYTFGDNRYGQLGRATCAKVEGRRPYPVPDMLRHEATMVAAGIHHCLVLVAPGLVWSWGRNKGGQLGCGDMRDRIRPVKVERSVQVEGVGQEFVQLGHYSSDTAKEDREGCRIVTIGAGMMSSVAAGLDSNIWQWGLISEDFKERKPVKDLGKALKYVEVDSQRAQKTRPFQIFERVSFKPAPSRDRPLVSETGCRVLGHVQTKGKKKGIDPHARVKELTAAAHQLHQAINDDRAKLEEQDAKSKTQGAASANEGKPESSAKALLNELTDTINKMEREIVSIQHEVARLDKMLGSCDLQQDHTRKQLNTLMQQAAQLSEDQDKMNVLILNSDKKGLERKKLEEQAEQIKSYMESNKVTKMALLDQRAETDKEKQRITYELKQQQEVEERIHKRLEILRNMSSSVATASGISDTLIRFLKDRMVDFEHHFDQRELVSDLGTAMQEIEADRTFLNSVEAKLQEQVRSVPDADQLKKGRAEKIRDLLMDVINLRRSWNELLRDRWLKEELNMGSFFPKSGKTR